MWTRTSGPAGDTRQSVGGSKIQHFYLHSSSNVCDILDLSYLTCVVWNDINQKL